MKVVLLVLWATVVVAGPLETLRPHHIAREEEQKMREALERKYQAKAAAESESEATASTEASPETSAEVVPKKFGIGAALLPRGVRLPVCLGATALVVQRAVVAQRRRVELRELAIDIEEELAALQELAPAARRVEPPACASSRSVCERRVALDELRLRRELLTEVVPKAAQLQYELTGGKPLAQRSVAELSELNSTLTLRIEACGHVLAEYESLGQPPPPGFRTWPVATLRERHVNMTSRREALVEIVSLLDQLGKQRMDWSVPEMTPEQMGALARSLRQQVEEAAERKEKASLLGQIEAEMWRRREETPMATATLGVEELKALLAKLQGTPTAGGEHGAPEDAGT